MSKWGTYGVIRVWGRIKKCITVLAAIYLVLTMAVPQEANAAAAETRYELRSGGVDMGNDLIITGLDQAVFHQQTLQGVDDENLSLGFPGALSLNDPGSPGGNVGMALPSISQSSLQSTSIMSAGFFTADLPFYPCCNYGATPVGVGQFGKPSPVTPASFKGNSLLYPAMVVQGNLVHKLPNVIADTTVDNTTINASTNNLTAINDTIKKAMNKSASNNAGAANNTTAPDASTGNVRISMPPLAATGAFNEVAAVANVSGGNTVNQSTNRSAGTPAILSCLTYNFDAPADQINNTSIVERLWRNSHLACLLDTAYEGDATHPKWMMPHQNMTDDLQWRNTFKALKYSLNETRPGEFLTHSFWDI